MFRAITQSSPIFIAPASLSGVFAEHKRTQHCRFLYTVNGRVFCYRKNDSLLGSVDMFERVYVSTDGFAYELFAKYMNMVFYL